jgi:hypothetical protein
LDRNQIGHLKVLKRELLARNLHWYWAWRSGACMKP